MAQKGEMLVPNSSEKTEQKPFIEAFLTFKDTIHNGGKEVGVKVRLTPMNSKSSLDENGLGREMFRISSGGKTTDPSNGREYIAYTGFLGAYDSNHKFTKTESED